MSGVLVLGVAEVVVESGGGVASEDAVLDHWIQAKQLRTFLALPDLRIM